VSAAAAVSLLAPDRDESDGAAADALPEDRQIAASDVLDALTR
jgi:hypothetical protein